MSKNVKPLKSLTKIEAEKQSKLLAGELAEELDVLGQESDLKAAKWIKEKEKEVEKTAEEKNAVVEEKLANAENNYYLYRDRMLNHAKEQFKGFDVPPGFYYGVYLTDKGLVFWFRAPNGKSYAKGMKISTFVVEDMQGVIRLIHQALDHIEMIDEEIRNPVRSKGGIYLP